MGLFQGQERGTSSCEDRTRAGELTELKLWLEELQFEGRAWCPSSIQQWQSTVQAGSSSRWSKVKKHPSESVCVVRGFWLGSAHRSGQKGLSLPVVAGPPSFYPKKTTG